MSATVELYISYSGDPIGLAHRIARELGCVTYHYAGRQFDLTFEAGPWIGAGGTALLIMSLADRWRHGYDSGEDVDNADAPYQFELALEFRAGDRGTLRRLGRALFEHLSTLDLPLLYGMGEADVAYADFLPGRGEREFPAATPMDGSGRAWWYEPRLYTPPLVPWPGDVAPVSGPPTAYVLSIATGTELRLVAGQPDDGPHRWSVPAVSTTVDIACRDLGLLLAQALHSAASPPNGADILRRLAADAQQSTEDFVHRSTTVGVGVEGSELVARVYGAGALADRLDPRAAALVGRIPVTAPPETLGQLLVDLLAKARTL
jgi:hypothetical protein